MDAAPYSADARHPHSDRTVIFMGDKSPKAKEKSKKQDTADKNQKKAAANAKASTSAAKDGKKK
jgi:hypothetical protein